MIHGHSLPDRPLTDHQICSRKTIGRADLVRGQLDFAYASDYGHSSMGTLRPFPVDPATSRVVSGATGALRKLTFGSYFGHQNVGHKRIYGQFADRTVEWPLHPSN